MVEAQNFKRTLKILKLWKILFCHRPTQNFRNSLKIFQILKYFKWFGIGNGNFGGIPFLVDGPKGNLKGPKKTEKEGQKSRKGPKRNPRRQEAKKHSKGQRKPKHTHTHTHTQNTWSQKNHRERGESHTNARAHTHLWALKPVSIVRLNTHRTASKAFQRRPHTCSPRKDSS